MQRDAEPDADQPERRRLADCIEPKPSFRGGLRNWRNWPGWILFVFIFVLIATFSVIGASCGSSGHGPANPEKALIPTTSIPKPVVHTATKHLTSDPRNMPNAISYVWHGTIDGYDCIIVEDSANPSLWCNPKPVSGG